MAGHQADQLFVRFQRTGDPDLLAQVFDLTAAKLLRVAIHLSQDPAAAEDLVQATFVTAMEKVDQYRIDRPLLPWLSGILELHAKTSRSKSRRKIEPSRLGDPLEEDPERRAQENELGEAVDAALDRIPETYRTVLLLKLRHGMSPAQIADALARSPGAVRVQIHRGLEMLRKLLPASIALSAICAFTPTRGLAAMRRELKRQAGLQLAPAGIGIVTGGLLMKKVVASLALAAVAISGGLFLYQLDDSASIPVADAGMVEGESSFQSIDGLEGSSIDREDSASFGSEQAAAERTLAQTPESNPNSLLVKVLWADDRTPAQGVGVTVRPHDGRHPRLHTKRRVTSKSGLASFEDLAAGIVGIYADRKLHVPKNDARLDVLLNNARGIELDLNGDIQTIQGVATLPKFSFELQPAQNDFFQARTRYREVAQRSLESSLVQIHDEIAVLEHDLSEVQLPSDFSEILEASGGKVRLLDPTSLDLPSKLPDEEPVAVETVGDEPVYVEVLIERGIDLQGRVLDGTGEPIADAEIWVLGKSNEAGQVLTRSRDDGSFDLEGLQAGSRILARAAGFEPSQPFKLAKVPDNKQVEKDIILANRAGILRGLVFDQHGNPLPDAALQIGNPKSKLPAINTRSDAGGGFQAVGLPRGEILVIVLAPGFQPYQAQLSIQAESITEQDIHMQPGWVLAGQIFDPEGKPLEGQTIYAESEGKPTTEVTSGKDGSFRLETLAPGPVTLVVKEDEFRELRESLHGSAGMEQEQDLHLPAWGSIAGRIESSSGEPLEDWRVKAFPLAEGAKIRSDKSEDDGAFEMQTVPELRYRLEVYPNLPRTAGTIMRMAGGGETQVFYSFVSEDGSSKRPSGRRVIECDWLGEISGNRQDLVIQIPDEMLPSAQLQGRVMSAQGEPLPGNLHVWVDGKKRSVKVDKDGSFDTGLMIPGDYAFQLAPKDRNYPPFYLDVAHLSANEKLDLGSITPPQASRVQIEVMDNRANRARGLKVQILDAQGRSVTSTGISFEGRGGTSLAAGDYQVNLMQGGQVIDERSLRVSAGSPARLRFELND
ncbi:MAG: sigma-70 family RNA polymerase sigma factor [Planctomycetota bacterium]|jgi:RNA polymerase sigma-70 factor (ECF subfamily)